MRSPRTGGQSWPPCPTSRQRWKFATGPRQIAAREGRGATLCFPLKGRPLLHEQASSSRRDPVQRHTAALCRAVLIGGEAGEIGGDELGSEMREERGGPEGTEIGVEVLVHRHEVANFEAGFLAAFVQPLCGMTTGGIVVARGLALQLRF